MRSLLSVLCVCLLIGSVDAGGKHRRSKCSDGQCYSGSCSQGVSLGDSILAPVSSTNSPGGSSSSGFASSIGSVSSSSSSSSSLMECSDALSEVNAARSQRGLRPFQPDESLRQAAYSCAKQRASRLISGHLPESDFHYLNGNASAAGCAAWPQELGFGSCCLYENYTYAGAAWAIGKDGKRYCHLFVR